MQTVAYKGRSVKEINENRCPWVYNSKGRMPYMVVMECFVCHICDSNWTVNTVAITFVAINFSHFLDSLDYSIVYNYDLHGLIHTTHALFFWNSTIPLILYITEVHIRVVV